MEMMSGVHEKKATGLKKESITKIYGGQSKVYDALFKKIFYPRIKHAVALMDIKPGDSVLDVGVEREACPLGLAPTASSTALLAMGDALAVVLLNKKHFNTSDFKKIHPGGTLGQRLAGKIRDIMLTGTSIPRVVEGTSLEDAIREINRLELGATFVVSSDDILVGIITDGDLRRFLVNNESVMGKSVEEVMSKNPQTVNPHSPAFDALNIMEKFQITVLPITDSEKRVLGILHLHDILSKGEFKFNEIGRAHV